MKQDAAKVLQRPISEGFGFMMLQKMGWKEGEGIGKTEKGLATPLWIDPREGKNAGLFSTQAGEQRPKKVDMEDNVRYNPAEASTMFIPAGGRVPGRPRAPRRPPPTAATVAPAVLDMLMDRKWQGGLAANSVADLLAEALTGEAGERFLRLVDQRLGPQVAPRIAQMKKEKITKWSSNQRDEKMAPLWQLTKHHVPGAADEEEEE